MDENTSRPILPGDINISARFRVAVSLIGPTLDHVLCDIDEVNRLSEKYPQVEFLLEPRMDLIEELGILKRTYADKTIERIIKSSSLAKIFTHRHPSESGDLQFVGTGAQIGTEAIRISYLQLAMQLGAEYIDIEHRLFQPEYFADILAKLGDKRTKIIVSYHDTQNFPNELLKLYRVLCNDNPDIVKIAAATNSQKELIEMMGLIDYVHGDRANVPLIGVCMSDDPIVRMWGPKIGAYLTFAAIDEKRKSARGQMAVNELLEVWDKMGYIPKAELVKK